MIGGEKLLLWSTVWNLLVTGGENFRDIILFEVVRWLVMKTSMKTLWILSVIWGENYCDLILCEAFLWLMAKTYMTEYFVNAFSDLRWNLRECKTLCNLSVTGGKNFCDLILCDAFQWLMAKTFTKYVSSTRRNLASNNSACIVDSRKLIYFYFGS